QSAMVSKFEAQELEINSLKVKIKLLEDKDKGVAEQSGDDAPIKGGDVQLARELEEEMIRDTQRMNKHIARDAKIARIHAEEERQMLIDGLDRNNKTTQQRKPLTRKQQREFYTSVLRNQAGWKAKHFKGMTLEEIKEKFDLVWKQIQDFVPIGSKEEAKRFKRKGLILEQESVKKLKTSEEVKATEEVLKEKVKEMM
nr:hypothetical protein [Tanacetum cinerariifolium]